MMETANIRMQLDNEKKIVPNKDWFYEKLENIKIVKLKYQT